ncbi:rho GTPase-activating protein 20-like isoform X2 [Seriola aureovittata]|uniref:rho GTPase-activating protein 20-like isoform X2 n=1 Tax=Seriola aureovittata TaxID=2871759 RepID=UPI0024BDACB9|nr:rho GTPase-activating protein 20-like isoform X2 [Seriola aureovittata]
MRLPCDGPATCPGRTPPLARKDKRRFFNCVRTVTVCRASFFRLSSVCWSQKRGMRREEEMMRHREQEDLRRQPDGFKPNYPDNMWTAGCTDEVCEGSTNPDRSFVIGWPTSNCVATFSSTEQKERWLSTLRSRIKEEKEKEEPKTIPLRVYGKGINTFAVTKTLPVSNSDSTNEVIRLALRQFGIIRGLEAS